VKISRKHASEACQCGTALVATPMHFGNGNVPKCVSFARESGCVTYVYIGICVAFSYLV
jgi:hypothetical protein